MSDPIGQSEGSKRFESVSLLSVSSATLAGVFAEGSKDVRRGHSQERLALNQEPLASVPCQASFFELRCGLDRSVVARKQDALPARSTMTLD